MCSSSFGYINGYIWYQSTVKISFYRHLIRSSHRSLIRSQSDGGLVRSFKINHNIGYNRLQFANIWWMVHQSCRDEFNYRMVWFTGNTLSDARWLHCRLICFIIRWYRFSTQIIWWLMWKIVCWWFGAIRWFVYSNKSMINPFCIVYWFTTNIR